MDSNRGPLEWEATALPTEPQPLLKCERFTFMLIEELLLPTVGSGYRQSTSLLVLYLRN